MHRIVAAFIPTDDDEGEPPVYNSGSELRKG